MPFDPEEAANYAGLTPSTIPGSTPGASYRVILRTPQGLLAVRRIASQTFRVRIERFDAREIQVSPRVVAPLQVHVGDGAKHVSATVVGHAALAMAISRLCDLLVLNELDPAVLPIELEPEAEAHEKALVARAKQTLAELGDGAGEAPAPSLPETDTDPSKKN